MMNRLSLGLLAVALAVAVSTPADAANKEHQQMAADLRMLQEQAQHLANLIGTVTDALKGLNTKLDQQAEANRKSLADQKLVVDNLSNDVRVIREKLDDNNVRIGSLTQEVEALRQAMQQGGAPSASAAEPPPASSTGGSGTSPQPPPSVAVGTSPAKVWDGAYADYTAGQWDLAIIGFEQYIRAFPSSDRADNAQVNIGNAYLNDGKNDKAVEAYDKAIRTYPNGDAVPEAYYKKGLALQNLRQTDRAREAWEFAVKTYPESDGGRMAKQRLDQLGRR